MIISSLEHGDPQGNCRSLASQSRSANVDQHDCTAPTWYTQMYRPADSLRFRKSEKSIHFAKSPPPRPWHWGIMGNHATRTHPTASTPLSDAPDHPTSRQPWPRPWPDRHRAGRRPDRSARPLLPSAVGLERKAESDPAHDLREIRHPGRRRQPGTRAVSRFRQPGARRRHRRRSTGDRAVDSASRSFRRAVRFDGQESQGRRGDCAGAGARHPGPSRPGPAGAGRPSYEELVARAVAPLANLLTWLAPTGTRSSGC